MNPLGHLVRKSGITRHVPRAASSHPALGVLTLVSGLLDLDFAGLARGFALLRMPRMPELRGKQFPDFVPVDVNTDTIPFKDKTREKQRKKLLEQQKKEKAENEGRRKFIKNKAWSKQKAKKEKKKKMNDKRKREEVKFVVLLHIQPRSLNDFHCIF